MPECVNACVSEWCVWVLPEKVPLVSCGCLLLIELISKGPYSSRKKPEKLNSGLRVLLRVRLCSSELTLFCDHLRQLLFQIVMSLV